MTRLRYVAQLNPVVSKLSRATRGTEVSFLPLERIWADDRFDPSDVVQFNGELQSYNAVAEGDLLVPKVAPTFSHGRVAVARGLVNGLALATSEVFVVRPHDPADASFIKYRLIATDFRQEGQASWTGVAGLKRVSASFLRDVRITPEAWRARSAISEFLDRECARIDLLSHHLDAILQTIEDITEHQGMSLFEQHGMSWPAEVGPDVEWPPLPTGWRRLLLGQALRELTNGYVGPTRDILVEEGVPYIQSTHIKGGQIDFDRRPFFVREAWHDARPRINLRTSDVLIVQTGKLGETAIVPPSFGPASCHALLIARVKPQLLNGAFLAAWFRTYYGRESLLKMATGALHPHLEAGEIRKLHIAIPPAGVQQSLVRSMKNGHAQTHHAQTEMIEFREMLSDYREALITEAVTGRLDVSQLGESQMVESLDAVRRGERPEVLKSQ